MMRNWPYAVARCRTAPSPAVAGRFAVAPMPAGPGGRPTAAFGGAQLAINAFSPEAAAAWLVIEYLTRPEQMLERAQIVGQFPTRTAVYDDPGTRRGAGDSARRRPARSSRPPCPGR